MTKRPFCNAILVLLGFAAASHALAVGFGRIPESVAFGQTLDISVPLRLDPGESASPGCLRAEVSLGEQRVPADTLRISVERSADGSEGTRIRLRSSVVVQEPLVAVSLAVGCNGSVSRQFVLFADPPGTSPNPPLTAEPVPTAATTAMAAAAPVRTEPNPAFAARATPARSDTQYSNARPLATQARTQARAQTRQTPQASRKAAQARAVAPTQAAVRSVERAAPRLKLEEPEERLRVATLAVAAQDEAAAQAAQAASVAMAAASAAEQRMALLEKSLQELQAEAAAHRSTVEQMRQRVAQSEGQGRWLWALATMVLVLAACALWLAMRLRALQRERQADWWLAAQAAGASDAAGKPASDEAALADRQTPALPGLAAPPGLHQPQQAEPAGLPTTPAAIAQATLAAAAQQGMAIATATVEDPSSSYRSAAMVGNVTPQEALTRAVSVDELIDLEQQAEFFVVLGEEDAAIDLLMSHLRSTGGISPLPYLKLLEIYRRRQDHDAYERVRKRFNHRFNAVAPDWQTDPDNGRDLQDYPAVLAAVQSGWHAPLDAMAELENLLFRKRSNELFDLPAYRDVLTLFAVARDLHRLDEQEQDDVDVLLPLLNAHEVSAALSNSIFDRLDRTPDAGDGVVEDRPTAPVDLDLNQITAVDATLQRSH